MQCLGTLPLETQRTQLRRFRIEDSPAVYQGWGKLEECSRYFPWGPMPSPDFAQEKVKGWVERYPEGSYYQWAIVEKESGQLIGVVNLHSVDGANHLAETSYILSPAYWGRGIMTEVLREVLRFAFEEVGLHRVEADCFVGNEASKRVLEKCGMTCEGVSREKYWKDGGYLDAFCYAILQGEACI